MMRFLLLLCLVLLGACATKTGKDGRAETHVDLKYLVKSEVDRIADTARSEMVNGLILIADKLYRRNPREWKKAGVASREDALARLRQRRLKPLAELEGAHEAQAATLAFAETYSGDRVAALMFGLLDMVDAAFEYKDEFFVLDSLNQQKLYNCARNLEIAIWKLGHDRNAAGELIILSNELDPANRNLSFEREFGRLIGLLDFMAQIVADRNGRGLTRFTHAAVTTIFFPVGLLK